jgi:hypothetical protein
MQDLDLNKYAGTIAHVFEQIAVIYGPLKSDAAMGSDWSKVATNLLTTLDADTCAEVIQVARTIEETQ